MGIEKSAGAVIFRKEKNTILYLLIQYGLGHWEFPRGNLASGEGWHQAAEREIKEETGLSDIKFLDGFKEVSKFFYKKEKQTIYKIVTYFLAETSQEEIKLSYEHRSYRWLQYDEAYGLVTYEKAKEVLFKAQKYITRDDRLNI